MKIAAMADAYETNVAPRNFHDHRSSIASAIPRRSAGFRIMETGIDERGACTHPPR